MDRPTRCSRLLLAAFFAVLMLTAAAGAEPPGVGTTTPAGIERHFAGIGVRAFFRDTTAMVLGARLSLIEGDRFSVAVRPALLLSGVAELRMAVTAGVRLGTRGRVYLGAGAAFNESGSGVLYPMATAGIDVKALGPIVLNLNGNYLLKPYDGDAEASLLVAWQFGEPDSHIPRNVESAEASPE